LSFLKAKADTEASAESTSAKQANQQMADEVGKALRAAHLKGYDIEIECKNGVATLSGKIADGKQKAQATRLAAQVPGVKRVDNQLTVIQTANVAANSRSTGARPAGYPASAPSRSRSMIRQVSDEVPAGPEGLVEARQAASEVAIQSNQQVAQSIANALNAARLNGYDIEIQYQNGTALLQGSIATPEQHALATRVVSSVPGVRSVQNQLMVQDQATELAAPPQRPVAPAGFHGAGQAGGPEPAMAAYGNAPAMANAVYDMPNLPEYAWPTYASYPNYAQVAYPQQYSASAWPYIGPFYPYPQVPLGWRRVSLEWDDGAWNLNFNSRTDKWWWFLHPKNW